MDERVIAQADLRAIENNLGAIHSDLQVIDSSVGTVNDNVKVVYDEIGTLAQDFHDFVMRQEFANNVMQAETRLVKIRQELDKKYGHYDLVRRSTTGILQADDLGIVKKDTISNATEELMISTPGYWLAPCLVALAAWINDQPELAEKALKEGIKRNDEKTSLFFALICRRADRKQACLLWTQRYLANQNEEDLDRKCVIVLDAYASGLLGADTEGVIGRQIDAWLAHLQEAPGFVERQTEQWSDAINAKRKPVDTASYVYLSKYSRTWPVLEDILEGANLHAEMLDYLTGIFEQKISTATVKQQLDDILTSLVSDYDDEELPLRKEEKYNQFIVDFGGDINRAKNNMAIEQTAFDTHKDFTQLLTDSAMKPESSHASVSTQKFAFALSRDWVVNAYNDVTAKNRMKVPNEIEINVENFNDITEDGENEEELLGKFKTLVETERDKALAQCKLSAFEQYCLYGGIGIGIIGIILMCCHKIFFGLIAIIAGIGLIVNHFSKKKQAETNRQNVIRASAEKLDKGSQIIRATLAEVVDFRAEFEAKDAESAQVLEFLQQLSPEQYVKQLSEATRRIKV